jgi:hypothetical protein
MRLLVGTVIFHCVAHLWRYIQLAVYRGYILGGAAWDTFVAFLQPCSVLFWMQIFRVYKDKNVYRRAVKRRCKKPKSANSGQYLPAVCPRSISCTTFSAVEARDNDENDPESDTATGYVGFQIHLDTM